MIFLYNLSSFICNENVIEISTLTSMIFTFSYEGFIHTLHSIYFSCRRIWKHVNLVFFCFAGAIYVIRWFWTAYLLLRITRWPPWKRASEEKLLKWCWLKRNAIKIFSWVVSCRDETQCVGNVHNASNWQLFAKENVLLCFWLPQWNYMFPIRELFSTISP